MIRLIVATRVIERVNSFKLLMVISSFLFRVFSSNVSYGEFDLVGILLWYKGEHFIVNLWRYFPIHVRNVLGLCFFCLGRNNQLSR